MQFKIIEELKRAEPKRRHAILMRMREKNLRHLSTMAPALAKHLETSGTGRFEVVIDQHFLELVDRTTGERCHPPKGLLKYKEDLAYRYHTGWIEKNLIVPMSRGTSAHGRALEGFRKSLLDAVPALVGRLATGKVHLPPCGNGLCYSGPVVFLGIFTGLQVMFYLARHETRDIFLIEPEMDRFAISCFFLDYELLNKHFGRLLLHVGPQMPDNPVTLLVENSPVVGASWMRMLPAYPAGQFDEIVRGVGLRWAALNQNFVPFDRELRNLSYGAQNLKEGRPLLKGPPQISKEATIAVVGSGPSLDEDLDWLKENEDRLIIFAGTSTVRALRRHGIRIDFQFALDTEIDPELLERLELDPNVPLVAYYKINPEIVRKFPTVLLLAERYKGNPAKLHFTLIGTHPTTGNMAAALAVASHPKQILLIGMDLGFRSAERSHFKGSLYDDADNAHGHLAETAGRDTLLMESNFAESKEEIYSNSYLNSARLSLENIVGHATRAGIDVMNLSDGIRIAGARPSHSNEVSLVEYPAREDDVRAIKANFNTDSNELWSALPISGKERFAQLRAGLLEALAQDESGFDWKTWAIALDEAWKVAASKAMGAGDIRVEVYCKVVTDMLSDWFRLALMSNTIEEAASIFAAGIKALEEALLEMPDPADAS